MKSEPPASKMNMEQKTSLLHNDGVHSRDILRFLYPFKTNQLHQRMMMSNALQQHKDCVKAIQNRHPKNKTKKEKSCTI